MCMINDSHIRYRSSSSKQTMNNTNLPLLLLLPFVFIAVFSFVLFSIYVCFVFFFCAGAMRKVSVIRCCLTNSLCFVSVAFFFHSFFRTLFGYSARQRLYLHKMHKLQWLMKAVPLCANKVYWLYCNRFFAFGRWYAEKRTLKEEPTEINWKISVFCKTQQLIGVFQTRSATIDRTKWIEIA